MASSYPTSLDTFTNPTGSDNLDSPDHATQHADVNDAVEALEAKVGIGSSPASGASAKQVLQADGAGASAWATVAANDLSDVDTNTASPSVGDALVWDGSNWVPDSGTYRADDEPVIVLPGMFEARGGSPARTASGASGNIVKYLLDAASNESLTAQVRVPASWSTFDMKVVTMNAASGSGDYVLQTFAAEVGVDGASASGSAISGPTSTTVTALGQGVRKDVTPHTSMARPATGMVLVAVNRLATDGADTLANDVGLLWVELIKAS